MKAVMNITQVLLYGTHVTAWTKPNGENNIAFDGSLADVGKQVLAASDSQTIWVQSADAWDRKYPSSRGAFRRRLWADRFARAWDWCQPVPWGEESEEFRDQQEKRRNESQF